MADAVLAMQALANPDKYSLDGTDERHIQYKVNQMLIWKVMVWLLAMHRLYKKYFLGKDNTLLMRRSCYQCIFIQLKTINNDLMEAFDKLHDDSVEQEQLINNIIL